jgi:hypothetical protein
MMEGLLPAAAVSAAAAGDLCCLRGLSLGSHTQAAPAGPAAACPAAEIQTGKSNAE